MRMDCKDATPQKDKTWTNIICQIIKNWKLNFKYATYYVWIQFRKLLNVLRIWRFNIDVKRCSEIVEQFKEKAPDYRKLLDFEIRDIPIFRANRNHTHGFSAAERSGVSNFIQKTIEKAGMTPYYVGMSNEDARQGRKGCRYFYWDKDLTIEYKDEPIGVDDVLVFIDVDFHAHMPDYLKHYMPIIMYTVSPDKAASSSDEFSYYIKDDVLHYNVRGGAEYEHKIWDYRGDIVSVASFGELLLFHVTQHVIEGSPHRRIITLLPACRITGVGCWFLPAPLKKTGLVRRVYTQNGVNVVYDPITNLMSMARNGSSSSVEIDRAKFEALQQRALMKKGTLTIGDVEVYLGGASQDRKVEAALLHAMLNTDIQFTPTIVPTHEVRKYYTALGPLATEEPIEPCMVLTTPLVTNPAMFPTATINNELAAIEGRINRPWNNTRPPAIYEKYAREFVHKLVPDTVARTGLPWDFDAVYEKQTKVAQKGRAKLAEERIGIGCENKLKMFLKGEAYSAANHPRIITTMSPELTIQMSRYTYPFKEAVLKPLDWYGPGKTPKESVERLRILALNGGYATDFDRFDGSIPKWMFDRIVERAYMRYYNAADRVVLKDYITQVFKEFSTTKSGIRYAAGPGTRSGSPPTTDGNTMIAGFLVYSTYRKMGYNTDEAWEHIGLICSDDGFHKEIPGFGNAFEDVTKIFGFSVRVEHHPRDTPISYLGRTFPSILTSYSSHQDIKRTLVKIHLTSRKTITREQAATNRAIGYYCTDKLTPLIGDWCSRVLEITGLKAKELDSEENWKVQNCAWPQAATDVDLLEASVCAILSMTNEELQQRKRAIKDAQSLDQFPIIWDNQPQEKIAALTNDGEVTPGERITEVIKTNNVLNQQTNQSKGGKRAAQDDKPEGARVVRCQLETKDGGTHPRSSDGCCCKGRQLSGKRRQNARSRPSGSREPHPGTRRLYSRSNARREN